MATSSIKNIESGNSRARHETLTLIRDAFATNGVEFLPGSGVKLKNNVVAFVDGKGATAALLDSLYTTAHASPDREVCIIGLDESYAEENDGAQLLRAHIARLKQAA